MRRKIRKKIEPIPLIICLLAAAIILLLLYIVPGRYRLYQTTLFDPLEQAAVNPLMGFAPDASVKDDDEDTKLVSIHLSWKDWEPAAGEYDTAHLSDTFHIKFYKKKNAHAVLRFDCSDPKDGIDRDIKEAIASLGEYFSGDSFVSFVEVDRTGKKYVDEFQEAFPQAKLILTWNQEKAGTDGNGVFFDNIGDVKRFRKEISGIKDISSWKAAPNAGAFSARKDTAQVFDEDLSEVLQEIREGHITYLSGVTANKDEKENNGYKMISRTLGYCIYISRLQTTVNLRKDKVTLQFTFQNTGVAPCYAQWPVVMTVYSHRGHKVFEGELPMSPGSIPPGGELLVKGEFPYNNKLTRGYSIGISICNPENRKDYITLSQKGTRPDEKGEHIIYTFEPESTGRKADIARPDSYQGAMINLLADLSDYAKEKNPEFAMITNGGYKLYMPKYNKSEENLMRLNSTMDGMIIETVYYGWDEKLDRKTPENMTEEMEAAIKEGKKADLAVFNIEYCTNKEKRKKSENKSQKAGSVWYNAKDMELSTISELSEDRAHDGDCMEAAEAENFIALLNPDHFATKEEYLKAVADTDYDLIFIDQDYAGEHLTKKEIRSLKKKKNGGTRMVCSYMSVGEAESYRSYWQEKWTSDPPPWICDPNRKWKGNYKVMYWTKSWRDILFGHADSYLDQIIAAGFDGVYLDVVDAYEYFEEGGDA